MTALVEEEIRMGEDRTSSGSVTAEPVAQQHTRPTARYVGPVHVRGRLDEPLSRWLWLVKWLLLIPHWIVLWFLWFAFVALTLVALIAIVCTGRYPARDLRVQRRRAALGLAGGLLRLRRERHRPLPAVHPRRAPGLPGPPRDRPPRAALPRPGPGQVVAAGDPAIPGGGVFVGGTWTVARTDETASGGPIVTTWSSATA